MKQSKLKSSQIISPELQQNVNVTWSCPEASYLVDIPMITYESQTFNIPSDAYGKCSLSINPPPLGFDSPQVVDFTIYWLLSISDYPSTLYPYAILPDTD